MLFKLLPNVQQRWSHVIIASTITTLLWIVATLIFRLYVQHFGSYNKTYGTIGGVIILLTWMYYSMFVVLVGGELASELHHGTGATEPHEGRGVPRADRLGFGAGDAVVDEVEPGILTRQYRVVSSGYLASGTGMTESSADLNGTEDRRTPACHESRRALPVCTAAPSRCKTRQHTPLPLLNPNVSAALPSRTAISTSPLEPTSAIGSPSAASA